MATDRKALNPLLKWLWDLLSFYSVEEITVPTDYHSQVEGVKEVLQSDLSGLANSILDFAVNCSEVDYSIESDSPVVADLLDEWFNRINMALLGRVPTGIEALSRQYFMERWKGSSFIVLRTIWETMEIEGTKFTLPSKMWFVDGANLVCEDKSDSRVIGDEKYYIKIDDRKKKSLPASKEELIFVQRPFSSWSSIYPIPYLIQRGIYKNLKFFELINKKGEKLVGKALEYLLLMKKGTEGLALKGSADFTYSEDDLKKAKDDFGNMLTDNKTNAGMPLYATNFDTTLEHVMPDYNAVFNKELYIPLERRILAGLGLIEIVEGVASTRRESILNPRPFIAEIEAGIEGFENLISDVLQEIKNKNEKSHPKYFGKEIEIEHGPIQEFVSDSVRDHFRSMYDRGVLSKETYLEVVGDIQLDTEVTRRKDEKKEKLDDVMYPPVVDNREGTGFDTDKIQNQQQQNQPNTDTKKPNKTEQRIPTKKQGPEAKNFKGAVEKVVAEVELGVVVKKKDGYHVMSKTGKHLGGPYKTKREAVKRLSQIEHFKGEDK